MQSRIFLEDVQIYAYHGVLPQENLMGTHYILNLEVHAPIYEAMTTDDLEDTISYADLNEILYREMAIPSKLLEHVAGRIIKSIERDFPGISFIKLKITKKRPPMKGECKGASVEFEKEIK